MSKKIVMNRKPKVLYQSKPLQMAENTLQLRRPMSVLSLTNNKHMLKSEKKCMVVSCDYLTKILGKPKRPSSPK